MRNSRQSARCLLRNLHQDSRHTFVNGEAASRASLRFGYHQLIISLAWHQAHYYANIDLHSL